MSEQSPEHCHIDIATYGTDSIAITHKIAKLEVSGKWIILRGRTTIAIKVARHIHLLLRTLFANNKPRGVCIVDAGKTYVHWDSASLIPIGSVLQ